MYLPFLRGKQYELIAITEMLGSGILTENSLPLIEPVKSNTKRLEKVIKDFQAKKHDIIIISNPSVGDLKKNSNYIQDVFEKKLDDLGNIIHGFLISSMTNLGDLKKVVDRFNDMQFCFIHISPFMHLEDLNEICRARGDKDIHILADASGLSLSYGMGVKASKRILLRDGFQKMPVNSEYPEFSYFSDLISTYKEMGFVGFSDYTIIGDDYSTTGGPAKCVAIHFSNIEKDGNLWVRHFKSVSDIESIANVKGKAYEAISFLNDWLKGGEYCGIETAGLQEYKDWYSSWAFHGLGHFKKISIKHHIELIQTKIS